MRSRANSIRDGCRDHDFLKHRGLFCLYSPGIKVNDLFQYPSHSPETRWAFYKHNKQSRYSGGGSRNWTPTPSAAPINSIWAQKPSGKPKILALMSLDLPKPVKNTQFSNNSSQEYYMYMLNTAWEQGWPHREDHHNILAGIHDAPLACHTHQISWKSLQKSSDNTSLATHYHPSWDVKPPGGDHVFPKTGSDPGGIVNPWTYIDAWKESVRRAPFFRLHFPFKPLSMGGVVCSKSH